MSFAQRLCARLGAVFGRFALLCLLPSLAGQSAFAQTSADSAIRVTNPAEFSRRDVVTDPNCGHLDRTNTIARRAYAAPSAGWRAQRIGYCSWRDPYRKGS